MGGKGLKNSICVPQIPLLSKSLLKCKNDNKPLYPGQEGAEQKLEREKSHGASG